jgi:hypothetical protein
MMSGFWSDYRRSLKPLEVEEPIDVWVHRPLAYVLAKLAYPTPISPNQITVISMVFGILTGVALASLSRLGLILGGLCIFLSAIFDCADGQLARMRGTSSPLGRILDGMADTVVTIGAVGGSIWVLWNKYSTTWWMGAIVVVVAGVTAWTGSFHTSMYDHYKNVFLRMTHERYQESEDLDDAERRYRERPADESWLMRLSWVMILPYLRGQLRFSSWYDPYTEARLGRLPAYSRENAEIYRQQAGQAMAWWRRWFGFGSLVFGLAVSIAFDVVEWYALARVVLLNAVFFLYLRPMQQEASRSSWERMGVGPQR